MERIELVWNSKQCGIYCIMNNISHKIYIGSSKDCYHRVRAQHYCRLRKGKHSNPHLQSAWNKYGEDNFTAFCLEICLDTVLKDKEQYWIKKTKCLDNKSGYNINPFADRTVHTEEQKRKISLSALGRSRRPGIPSGITKIGNNRGDSWTVMISFRNEDFYLGTFDSYDTALKVRKKSLANIKCGREPNWKWVNSLRVTPKKILQYDSDFNLVRKYNRISEVVAAGFESNYVAKCCNGWCKTYRNCHWRYEGEPWEYKR